MTKRIWFAEAVEKGPTKDLDDWSKHLPQEKRLSEAIKSRPTQWSRDKKYVSAGRALTALANVTKDPATKRAARSDAKVLFARARGSSPKRVTSRRIR